MSVNIDLSSLQTETRNVRTNHIDTIPTLELCRIINREDASVALAVESCLETLASAIDVLAERIRAGGRLVYIGAGTSGRLGVLDASEIPPTFSAPAAQFVGIIAGGDDALRNAKEGAEDSTSAAEADLAALDLDPEVDSLIGIASSGRTPYVLGGLAYAKRLGCTTVGLACAKPSAMSSTGTADFMIEAVSGPEVVTGSTRLKAGTATKMILNMISTGVMIKVGKTYGNIMVDLKATNSKLRQRAKNILRFIGGPLCPASDAEIEDLLRCCDGSVKLAAASVVLRVPVHIARESLARNNGMLAAVVQEAELDAVKVSQGLAKAKDEFVLCVDAGGSSCKAVIISNDGLVGSGQSGPCNASNFGLDSIISTISQAIQAAVDQRLGHTSFLFTSINISRAWVAIAGYDRPSMPARLDHALGALLKLTPGKQLRVTTDIDLLPATVWENEQVSSVIVLVAGTGSVAMRFRREGKLFVRTARAGGWGHLLGDEGSGFDLGRRGLQEALAFSDYSRLQEGSGTNGDRGGDTLVEMILDHFHDDSAPGSGESGEQDLLSSILLPDTAKDQAGDYTADAVKRIAQVAKVVISASQKCDSARAIIEAGSRSLARLVASLLAQGGQEPEGTALVLAGGLLQDETYRDAVMSQLRSLDATFGVVQAVEQPALEGARYLSRLAFTALRGRP